MSKEGGERVVGAYLSGGGIAWQEGGVWHGRVMRWGLVCCGPALV